MSKMLLELYKDSLNNLENVYVKNLTGLHERLKSLEDQLKLLQDALSDDDELSAQKVHWSE